MTRYCCLVAANVDTIAIIIVNLIRSVAVTISSGPFIVAFFWNIVSISMIFIDIAFSMNLSPHSFLSPSPKHFVTLIIKFEFYL